MANIFKNEIAGPMSQSDQFVMPVMCPKDQRSNETSLPGLHKDSSMSVEHPARPRRGHGY